MAGEWTEMEIDGPTRHLPIRVYDGACKKTAPLVLYLGGNAFQPRLLSQHERLAARALADAGAFIVEADCAGPDGVIFPQAVEDAFEVLRRLSNCRKTFAGARSKLLVAGDEAGGNIAAGVALKARDQMPGGLAGQVLLSPMLDPRMTSASVRHADEIGMRQRWADGWSRYLRLACGHSHPYAAPCLCSRLSGVAPALIVTSQDDPLRDEIAAYAQRLADSGGTLRHEVLPAGAGWPEIYRGLPGPWTNAVKEAFTSFLPEIA